VIGVLGVKWWKDVIGVLGVARLRVSRRLGGVLVVGDRIVSIRGEQA